MTISGRYKLSYHPLWHDLRCDHTGKDKKRALIRGVCVHPCYPAVCAFTLKQLNTSAHHLCTVFQNVACVKMACMI